MTPMQSQSQWLSSFNTLNNCFLLLLFSLPSLSLSLITQILFFCKKQKSWFFWIKAQNPFWIFLASSSFTPWHAHCVSLSSMVAFFVLFLSLDILSLHLGDLAIYRGERECVCVCVRVRGAWAPLTKTWVRDSAIFTARDARAFGLSHVWHRLVFRLPCLFAVVIPCVRDHGSTEWNCPIGSFHVWGSLGFVGVVGNLGWTRTESKYLIIGFCFFFLSQIVNAKKIK